MEIPLGEHIELEVSKPLTVDLSKFPLQIRHHSLSNSITIHEIGQFVAYNLDTENARRLALWILSMLAAGNADAVDEVYDGWDEVIN